MSLFFTALLGSPNQFYSASPQWSTHETNTTITQESGGLAFALNNAAKSPKDKMKTISITDLSKQDHGISSIYDMSTNINSFQTPNDSLNYPLMINKLGQNYNFKTCNLLSTPFGVFPSVASGNL